jgi:hypothetical protein
MAKFLHEIAVTWLGALMISLATTGPPPVAYISTQCRLSPRQAFGLSSPIHAQRLFLELSPSVPLSAPTQFRCRQPCSGAPNDSQRATFP